MNRVASAPAPLAQTWELARSGDLRRAMEAARKLLDDTKRAVATDARD